MTDPAIPNSYDSIIASIAALIAARPSTQPYVVSGKYGNVLAGWRAQAMLCISRIADEVRSSRLTTAQGDALRALVSSEFDIPTNTDGRASAVGYVLTNRAGITPGTVGRGTRFRRVANPSLSPPIKEAVYSLLEDTYITVGTNTFTAQCTQDGSTGNIFPDDGTFTNTVTTPYQWIDPVFDPTISFTAVEAGGGAEVTVDDDLRRAARAMAQGRYAPVLSALSAFAYRAGLGVRRVATFDDTANGVARLAVADGSRNGSVLWANRVKQALIDSGAVGFGCRIDVKPAAIKWVAVTATVVLRDANAQNFTTDISNSIRAALTSYFGDRDDWYAFKTAAVRAVISRADRRILTCSSATVTLANGTAQADTTPYVPGTVFTTMPFWTLASRGLSVQFVNPS